MSETHIAVGLIGAGRIGRLHAENLATRVQGARLAAVADVRVEAAREVAGRWQVPRVTADPGEILADPAIAAVAICSSSGTHAALIQEASARGKHVFCEKPIDLTVEPIERALAAARAAGVKLQIGFNRRFDASFARARQVVVDGRVGEVHLVRVTSRDPGLPPVDYLRRSGGIFLDMAIHDFDMVRFLTGSEVVDVLATGAALVEPGLKELGDVDTAVTLLRMANGALAAIDNSRRAVYGYDQRAEVFGSKGAVMVGNPTPDAAVLMDGAGAYAATPYHFFLDRYPQSFLAEMQAFVDCVRLDREPPVTGVDGLQATRIARAAARSLATGQRVAVG